MPENKPGTDALLVFKPEDGNPRKRWDEITRGFASRKLSERFAAKKLLLEEARRINLVAELSERELDILSRRFPQEGKRETQKKIGKDLGVSVTRVQQFEAKALRKLRKALYKSLVGQTP